MLNGLDLFSGIGALSLGLKGIVKPIAYCEIDPYAQEVLKSNMRAKHIHEAPVYGDVQKLSKRTLNLPPGVRVDVIYGGFPCQDISLIGNQKGLSGERSGLVNEIFRLTKELSPEFVFLENVPVIISNGLQEILQRFDNVGYNAQWDIVSAAMFGAPHLRKRWFLLATKKGGKAHSNNASPKSRLLGNAHIHRSDHSAREAVPVGDSARAQPERHSRADKAHIDRSRKSSKVLGAWRDPTWFQNEPSVARMAHGDADWFHRTKAIGNAVVPVCVRYAFLRLLYNHVCI